MSLPASRAAFIAGAEERLRRVQPQRRIGFPESDDPRGCSVDGVYSVAWITALQSESRKTAV